MNYNTAIKLLDLDKESINESSIKKKYKFMALKYHPDKNKSINATNKFSEIKDAYEYLMKYEGHMDIDDEYFEEEKDDKNYNSLLYQFINIILNEIKRALKRGDGVELRNFGTFRIKTQKASIRRNPKTGEKVAVPEKKVISWKMSKEMFKNINNEE